jgi:hypothetical protein
MKLLIENWRTFLNEQEEDTTVVGDFETIGDLRKALSAIRTGKAIDVGKKAIAGALGGASDVATAGVGPIIKALWSRGQKDPKLAKSSKVLDKLMIDPFVSKVVDDDVEREFIKDLSKEIDKKEDHERLADMDMTNLLSKYIRKDYAGTTVGIPKK